MIRCVVHAIIQGEVNGEVFPLCVADIKDISCPGEVLSKLVEGHCHHAISGIERLLDSVSVVYVNINVEDPFVFFKQFEDGQDAIVYIAKARGLGFLGMMQASTPIHNDVRVIVIQPRSASDAPAGIHLTEFKHAVEDGTVLPHIETLELACIVVHVVGGDDLEEVNVIIRMKTCHRGWIDEAGTEYVHLFVEAIVHHKVVCHSHAMWLHGVALAVVIVTHLRVVEIRHSARILARHAAKLIIQRVTVRVGETQREIWSRRRSGMYGWN
mmetsp:Transcript_8360/g.19617  ORF Transcript_8360/g.19617 Transcript_8360/m.19617 type:complete len:269 (-) Transcript_8360:28-834(-)